VDGEQRDVAEDDERRVRRERREVALDERELPRAEESEPVVLRGLLGLGGLDVGEREEVDAPVVEAVVAAAARALAEELQVALAVVDEDVVLAGDVERAVGLDRADDLPGGVELG